MPRKKVTPVPAEGAVQVTPAAAPAETPKDKPTPAPRDATSSKPGVYRMPSGATLIRN